MLDLGMLWESSKARGLNCLRCDSELRTLQETHARQHELGNRVLQWILWVWRTQTVTPHTVLRVMWCWLVTYKWYKLVVIVLVEMERTRLDSTEQPAVLFFPFLYAWFNCTCRGSLYLLNCLSIILSLSCFMCSLVFMVPVQSLWLS